MKYLSVPQTAERWGISARRIQILCSEDRIPGAVKIGNRWAIPMMSRSQPTQELKAASISSRNKRNEPSRRKKQRLRLEMKKFVKLYRFVLPQFESNGIYCARRIATRKRKEDIHAG